MELLRNQELLAHEFLPLDSLERECGVNSLFNGQPASLKSTHASLFVQPILRAEACPVLTMRILSLSQGEYSLGLREFVNTWRD